MNAAARLQRFKLNKSQTDVDRALRCLVRTTYAHVPYYRDLWSKAGSRVAGVRGRADLARLPVARRRSVAAADEQDRLHRGATPGRCVHTSTSGQLGLPVTISMSRSEALWRKLALMRVLSRYTSVRLPLRIADVGPMVPAHGVPLEQRMGLVRILRLPATLDPCTGGQRLQGFGPQIVEGYPTCLELVAEALERRGAMLPRTELVISRGEVLHAATRRLLSRAFACRVVDLFNCEEGGNLAWECPEKPGLWHVNMDACVLEVVDEQGLPVPPGCEGTVLLTNLFNHTMPFVRYELGDRAVLGEAGRCPCGGRGPTLASIEGRDDDFLIAPSGRRLSPRLVANTVFNALREPADPSTVTGGVRQFQVVQESPSQLLLRVVLGADGGMAHADRAARALETMAEGIACHVEQVGEIPRAPGGKLKKVVAQPLGSAH